MANKLCAGLPDKACRQVVSGKPRCGRCEREYNRRRNARRAQYQGDWPAQSKAAIAEHRRLHGDVCPGWRRSPHVIDPNDWTCDHDVGPLCRSCNGRKGGTLDRQRKAQR